MASARINYMDNALVVEHIGPHYVYLLVDPETNNAFYVGKGTEWRFAAHFEHGEPLVESVADDTPGAARERIAAIRARGLEPTVEFVRRNIRSPGEAYMVEAAVMDALNRHLPDRLTNAVHGHDAGSGLISYQELDEQLRPPLLDTGIRAILFKLADWRAEDDRELPRRGYGCRKGMSEQERYDSIRAWWAVSEDRARNHPYAVLVHRGITRAVYEIDHTSWVTQPTGKLKAFRAELLTGGDAFEAFVGDRGKRVPKNRPDGRAAFGSQGVFGYWPA